MTRERRLFALILGSVLVLMAATLIFLGWRDHRAEERCRDLGGVTYDAGVHCIIGPVKVVSTR